MGKIMFQNSSHKEQTTTCPNVSKEQILGAINDTLANFISENENVLVLISANKQDIVFNIILKRNEVSPKNEHSTVLQQSSLMMKSSEELLRLSRNRRDSKHLPMNGLRETQLWSCLITREMLRDNPDKTFLFGDNLESRGLGGQAKEMRYEKNAIGIPTKKKPDNSPSAFFSDDEYFSNIRHIENAIAEIPLQGIVVIPAAGMLAKLVETAPLTFKYLQERLKNL